MRSAISRRRAPASVRHQSSAPARIAGLLGLIAVLGLAGLVRAADYEGYSRTGWDYTNKAYCCEDAIAAAQENSARNCERAGGYADFRRGSARGRCDWEVERAGRGGRVYRCSGEASVRCR